MADWRLAKSLETFRNQVNDMYPGRSKTADGTIGDPAHAARTSDHNPDSNGVVAAIDITHDPEHLDIQDLADRLVASKDPRIKYIIANRKIWEPGKGWLAYTGSSDPHTGHLHLSVNRANYDDPSLWKLKEEDMTLTEFDVKALFTLTFHRDPTYEDEWKFWVGRTLSDWLNQQVGHPEYKALDNLLKKWVEVKKLVEG